MLGRAVVRLPVRLVVLVLLWATVACGAGSSDPRPGDVYLPTQPDTCTFALVKKEGRPAHPSHPEDWKGIQEDISGAEDYVGNFWSSHWKDCFSDVAYVPPASRGVYTSGSPFVCGGAPLTDVDNAFYCPADKSVAYGDVLMKRAVREGDALAYLVVAHEWGHAIQDLLRGTPYASFVARRDELQADCLAGAALWGSNYEGDFEWQKGDTGEAVDALKSLSDESEWAQPSDSSGDAHGDAVQRISAFGQGGSTTGVTNCFGMRPSESDAGPSPGPSSRPTPSPSPSESALVEIDARGHALTGWASPSGNLLCLGVGESEDEDASVRCDVLTHRWHAPRRPSSCRDGDWGDSLMLDGDGAGFACVGDPATSAEPGSDDTWWWEPGDPTTKKGLTELSYGRAVRISDDLVCSSERSGMTCRSDATGHGFEVSRGAVDHW